MGVPQRTEVCPFWYKALTKPLASLIRSLSLEALFHMFADDNQLYKSELDRIATEHVIQHGDLLELNPYLAIRKEIETQ